MAGGAELTCLHDSRGRCWLCSDQVGWWKEARIRAGLGETPPNAHRTQQVTETIDYLWVIDASWAGLNPRQQELLIDLVNAGADGLEYWAQQPNAYQSLAALERRDLAVSKRWGLFVATDDGRLAVARNHAPAKAEALSWAR